MFWPKNAVVSQPMFFTDGCAVEDFNWPDRIILGTGNSEAVLKLKQIYRPLVMRGVPVRVLGISLSGVARVTPVPVSRVAPAYRGRLAQGIPTASPEEAERMVPGLLSHP